MEKVTLIISGQKVSREFNSVAEANAYRRGLMDALDSIGFSDYEEIED